MAIMKKKKRNNQTNIVPAYNKASSASKKPREKEKNEKQLESETKIFLIKN